MHLVRPLCAGLAVWLAAWYLEPLLLLWFVTYDQLTRTPDRVLLVVVPELVIGLLVGLLAALADPAPYRDDRRRHVAVVLGTVALTAAITLTAGLVSGVQGWTVPARLGANLAGGGLGLALVAWIRSRRARAAARGAYF